MTTFNKIRQWADDRGLIENSTPKAQMTKLWEEYDELQAAIRAMDIEEIKDAIGDCMVVLTIISAQIGAPLRNIPRKSFDRMREIEFGMVAMSGTVSRGSSCGNISDWILLLSQGLHTTAAVFGLSIYECIDHAYDQIKDRKGHMNEAGVFVKEEA